jgi:hypothetical protein
MKTLILIIFCLLPLGCITYETHEIQCNSVNYNTQKDAWINGVMNTPLIKTKHGSWESDEYVELYYEECMLTYWHSKYMPYTQVETWSYSCVRKNGIEEYIQSSCGIVAHQINVSTLQRIKDKAEEILKTP